MISSLSYYLIFWMMVCSVHQAAAGLRGGVGSSTRDLTSTFECNPGQTVEEALFVMNVTVTGMTSDSQEETLESMIEGIGDFLNGRYASYIFGSGSSLDMEVQTPCDEAVSTRRRLAGNFFFPIGGSCRYCLPDNNDRRQLTTADTLEKLGNVLQFFLHFVLATHEGSYNPMLDVQVNIHEVATQGEVADNGC